MTKLSDTQAMILRAAAQRPEHIALPLPERLKGGAAHKVVDALLAKGMLAEIPAGDAPVWREGADGGVTLAATAAALDALGIETEDALPEEDAPETVPPETEAADGEAAPAPAAMTIDEAFEHAARETAAASHAPSPRAVATRDGPSKRP